MNNMKEYITKVNRDMGFLDKKHITEAKKGDVVIFKGGYVDLNGGLINTKNSNYTIGKKYVCRADYIADSYRGCKSMDEEEINGTIKTTYDDRKSNGNGWAAAFFELEG